MSVKGHLKAYVKREVLKRVSKGAGEEYEPNGEPPRQAPSPHRVQN